MLDDYFGRRLESAEAANCLVVLLVLELLSAFDALEATLQKNSREIPAKEKTLHI